MWDSYTPDIRGFPVSPNGINGAGRTGNGSKTTGLPPSAPVPPSICFPALPLAAILRAVFDSHKRSTIAATLVFAVFLWGGNNAGMKFLVQTWPPIWAGASRFCPACMLGFLRWTSLLARGRGLSALISGNSFGSVVA